MRFSFFVLGFLSLFLSVSVEAQFLKRSGKNIVNEKGEVVILRGMGLGNWMLQEPYMMNYVGGAVSQGDFKNKLENLIGSEKTNDFFNKWHDNFITKADIDSLSNWGFNSVRLAMHYNLFTLPIEDEPVQGENTWLPRGFELVDNLLSWCQDNEMYLILDLHAAPGGQGRDPNISDRDPSKPSLWESELNKSKTVALWSKLADRYKDTPWMGGYDLINETHWDFNDISDLRDLFIRITNAIREHDDKRILFVEGNGYANDFTGLTPPWDPNMAYSFHKYKTYNSHFTLEFVLNIQKEYNYPLWMGESGENSNAWATDAVKLFEELDIGWSWWTYKKLNSITNPVSFKSNSKYDALISYMKGESSSIPAIDDIYAGLLELAESTKIENVNFQKDYIDALLRQPYTDSTIPYSSNIVPGTIYASDYDLGNNLNAYYDTNSYDFEYSTGTYQASNSFTYRNDGVDVNSTTYTGANGYCIEYIDKGEWAVYTIDVEEDGLYDIDIFYSSTSNSGKISFEINGFPTRSNISLGNSGSYESFIEKRLEKVKLSKGENRFKFISENSGFDLSHFVFSLSSNQELSSFELNSSVTGNDFKSVKLFFNQPIDKSNITTETFKVFKNIGYVDISSVSFENNDQTVNLGLSSAVLPSDDLRATYNNGTVKSLSSIDLESFDLVTVVNNSLSSESFFLIPSKIEAEDHGLNLGPCVPGNRGCGFRTENCSDQGGGQNIAYADLGDTAAYMLMVDKSGKYRVDFRLASGNSIGLLRLGFKNTIGDLNLYNISQEKAMITTPYTGGWQNWETVSTEVNLQAGLYQMDLTVIRPEFNLNWVEFVLIEEYLDMNIISEKPAIIYPNPATDKVFIRSPKTIGDVSIFNFSGQQVKLMKNIETNDAEIDISSIKRGLYFINISSSNKNYKVFFN